MAMSGTNRMDPGRPLWNDGLAKVRLVPPPAPELESQICRWNQRRAAQRDRIYDLGKGGSPTGLKVHGVVWVQRQAGAADGCGEWRTAGEAYRLESDRGGEVSRVTGGEVHVDTLGCRRLEDAVVADQLSRVSEAFDARPAIGNRVAQMMDDGIVDGLVKV